MRFYIILCGGAGGFIGGAALLIFGFQLSETLSSGQLQLTLLQSGVIVTPDMIAQARVSIVKLMIGGAALVAVGIALSIIAVATKPKA